MNEKYPFVIAHWRLTLIAGVILILTAVGILVVEIYPLIFFFSTHVILVIAGFVFIPLLTGIQVLYAGFTGKEFQRIVENLRVKDCQVDILRLTLTFHIDNGEFSILYHALASPYGGWIIFLQGILAPNTPPEHYQVWTPISWAAPVYETPYDLGRYLRRSGIKGVLLQQWAQPIPPDNVLSPDLVRFQSHTIGKIPSLCYVGLATRGKSPILIALLRRDASAEDIVRAVRELGTMKDRIQNDQKKVNS